MRRFGRVPLLAATLALATLAAACDNPVEDEEHVEPIGAVVTDEDGSIIAGTGGASGGWDFQTGTELVIEVGTTMEVEVLFVDADGETFHADDLDGYQLAWTVDDESVVEILSHDGHVDITGLRTGETGVVFHLWHGVFDTSGHGEFSTPALPIRVAEPES